MKTLTIHVPDDVYLIAQRRAQSTELGKRTAEQVIAAAAEVQLRELGELSDRIARLKKAAGHGTA